MMTRDTQRIRRIKSAMHRAKLDALVMRLPENLVMSFGIWPMSGMSHGVFTACDGPVALIAPSCEDQEMDRCWASDLRFFKWPRLNMDDPGNFLKNALRELAKKHNFTHGRIGYEGSFEFVAPSHNAGEVIVPCENSIAQLKAILPKAKWQDATELLCNLRSTKTDMEIARLRIAHKVAGFGLKRFHEAVKPSITETQLASHVYEACLTKGMALSNVQHVNVFPQISSGPNAYRAWRPIVSTTRRKIKTGDIALLEMAVCVDGFWADVTRVKVAGKPSNIQKRAFTAVKQAQSAACQAIRPGIKASHPHEVATKILVDAGFEKQIVHLTGHGVGFRYHEPEPFLMPGNNLKLKKGHVCTVEPGLYDPEWGGIRWEDNVVVTNEGIENLTHKFAPRFF